MSNVIQSEPAYLLHSRPFRDTSLLVDFLTKDYGRIRAIAKGVRSPKSKNRAVLQAFIPLQINLSGKSELKTLAQVECLRTGIPLKHKSLFAAMYLNEILVRLLHKQDADADIFTLYERTLQYLSEQTDIEPILRTFELSLLELLGYGIDFSVVSSLNAEAIINSHFRYMAEGSFEAVSIAENSTFLGTNKYYPGEVLVKISENDFSELSTLKYAKRLLRAALSSHLGEKALASRNLFRKNIE